MRSTKKHKRKNGKESALAMIGCVASLVVAGAFGVAYAETHISNDTAILGVDVSRMTPEEAASEVEQELASRKVNIGEGRAVTSSELGFKVDRDIILQEARSNLISGSTVKPTADPVMVDVDKASEVVNGSEPKPEVKEPALSVRGGVVVVIPGAVGETLSKESIKHSVVNNQPLQHTKVYPEVSDEEAQGHADAINNNSKGVVIEVSGRSYKVSSGDFVNLATYTLRDGGVDISVDDKKVSVIASEAVKKLDTNVVEGVSIVNSKGETLRWLKKKSDGVTVNQKDLEEKLRHKVLNPENSPEGIQPQSEVVPASVVTKERRAVVDQSERVARFYENGELVREFPVAVGKADTPSDNGVFVVHTQLRTQDMGCNNPNLDYCVKGVPWITYYNNGEGFHGAPWHNDFGNPGSSRRSHGCINMKVSDSKWVYEFLTTGSTVEVKA